MAGLAAAALVLVLTSAAASLLLLLPVVVAAESLPALPVRAVRRFWIAANILPLLAGCLLTAAAMLSLLGDFTATPHQERIRGHLCVQQFTALPDAPFRFRLLALLAFGLLVYAAVRFVLTLLSTLRAEALAHRLAALYAPSLEGPGTIRPTSDALSPEGPSFSRPALAPTPPPEGSDTIRPALAPAPVLTLDRPDPDCFSLGLFRPVVLMTTGLRRLLSPEEVAAVLAHEQCHVRHRDNFVELLLRAVSDPLIWLPSTHYLLHATRLAQEQTCDAAAAEAYGAETLVSALRKTESAQRARQLRLQGDLAPLRPLFPSHANPAGRIAALVGEKYATLALPLPIVLLLEAAVIAAALLWFRRPLHDTLYCAASSLLEVLR